MFLKYVLVLLDYCFHKLIKKLMETYCGDLLVSIHDSFWSFFDVRKGDIYELYAELLVFCSEFFVDFVEAVLKVVIASHKVFRFGDFLAYRTFAGIVSDRSKVFDVDFFVDTAFAGRADNGI